MSRCVIVSAGPFRDPAVLSGFLQQDDYVIAADKGWQLACAMGVQPAVLVADFDSMPVPAASDGVKVVTLPEEKDETDTAYALKMAYDLGYREFLLLGCTGGRLDHFLTNSDNVSSSFLAIISSIQFMNSLEFR